MRGWIRHAGVYLAGCAFLVLVWTLTTGSVDGLGDIQDDATEALTPSFWPIFVIVSWGLAVALHLIVVLTGGGRRDRREPPPTPPAPEPEVAPAAVPTPPTARSVAVLFSDIVGSTRINETLGDDVYATLLRGHRAMVRELVTRWQGVEVSTQGDGFLVRFPTAVAAVSAACDIQRTVAERRATGGFVPEVRIGVHAGDAIDEGDDLVGTVLNVASRVCGAAEPGEVLVTEPVAERVAGRLTLEDRGLVELRGVRQSRHLFAVDWDDRLLPPEVPAPEREREA